MHFFKYWKASSFKSYFFCKNKSRNVERKMVILEVSEFDAKLEKLPVIYVSKCLMMFTSSLDSGGLWFDKCRCRNLAELLQFILILS